MSPSPLRRPRRVRFLPCVLVRETLHRVNYTPEERRATWYQRDDYAQMAAKNVSLVRKLQKGQGEKYCTRGLEAMVGEAQLQRVLRRAQLYAQVEDCQDDKNEEKDNNEETLRSISLQISQPACVEAQERALRDAIVAQCITCKSALATSSSAPVAASPRTATATATAVATLA